MRNNSQKQPNDETPIINKEECINVSVRIRPHLRTELGRGDIVFVDSLNDNKIKIGKGGNFYEGNYSKVFGVNSIQREVFDFCRNSVPDVFKGINSTVFAYGQTGSGKTYTMFGSDWTQYEKSEIIKSRRLDKNGNIM